MRATGKFATLRIRLTPKGGRDALARYEDGVLHVRVAAPPIDGTANRSLIELLARSLGVPRSRIEIVGGLASRDKVVRIQDLAAPDLEETLHRILAGAR